ncbi:MAG: hypothetical protein N3A64_02945 [Desulfobacterota bacterium]|nr:hypothetical protein [Thermodesulfobacteriota bacterium]
MILSIFSLAFFFLTVYLFIQYFEQINREKEQQYLQRAIQSADAIADHQDAVSAYQNIRPMLPEIELRILQRQWYIALEKLKQINLATANSELQEDRLKFIQQLRDHLTDMSDGCDRILTDNISLSDNIIWRIHNIKGAVKLLLAFITFQEEQNPDKAQVFIRDGLSEFKTSIEVVDKVRIPLFEKNIPRWNLEMLISQEYVKKLEVAKTDIEKEQALKENLEALIPEMGGYAPGEPIETKVKK